MKLDCEKHTKGAKILVLVFSKYSQTLLSQTRWNCLKTSSYPSIRDIEGTIHKK